LRKKEEHATTKKQFPFRKTVGGENRFFQRIGVKGGSGREKKRRKDLPLTDEPSGGGRPIGKKHVDETWAAPSRGWVKRSVHQRAGP